MLLYYFRSLQEELQREKEKHFGVQRDDKSTQSESKEEAEFTNPNHCESSINFQEVELLHGILSSLHEDYSSSLEKAVSAAQTNDSVDVSSLRAVINKRLGEDWSLLVLENAKMKSELDSIRSRINEEKKSFASELTALQINGENEKELQVEEGAVSTDKNMFSEGEGADLGSDQQMLEIMVYDQNKVIAKLEMHKLEVMKGLQRHKVDSNKNDDDDDDDDDGKIDGISEGHSEGPQQTKDNLGTIVKKQLHRLSTAQLENENLQNDLGRLRGKYSSLEQSHEDSIKLRECLEEKLKNLEEGAKNLCAEIERMKERNSELEEQLLRSTLQNEKVNERIKELQCKMYQTQQETEAITEQKIALQESLRQVRANTEHELASEREQKNILEKKLQEKTQQFEEERRLLQVKEDCLSKVEKELAETNESCKKLYDCVNEFETERGSMMKEINSLRCLQGLPTVNRAFYNREITSKQRSLQNGGEKRVENNRKNNKLNSELTRAKEQLVRLKAELTLSNMQTRNLGTQLSSLREDSTKLEAELSTVRLSPKNSRRRRNSFSYYDETVRLEIELGEAKERIIDLQEKLLVIYKEKFNLEEKILSLEDQGKKGTHDAVSSSQKIIKNETSVVTDFENNTEKSCATQSSMKHDQNQEMSLEQRTLFEHKIDSLEAEKAQLKKDLENTNADKSRLQGIECYVQQLVALEDEQLRLKSRLKMWAQSVGDEQHNHEVKEDGTVLPRENDSSKMIESIRVDELKELSVTNVALQEEAEILKETIVDLESDLATLKLELSMKDSIEETSRDKKAVATLLVSVKQERAELQKALDSVLIEKDDLEEELAEIKMKYTKLQREFAMTSMVKDDLELEILSLRKLNSDLTQNNEECTNEIYDSSVEDLIFYSDGSVEEREDPQGYGRKTTDGANEGKSMITPSKGKTVSIVTRADISSFSPSSERIDSV